MPVRVRGELGLYMRPQRPLVRGQDVEVQVVQRWVLGRNVNCFGAQEYSLLHIGNGDLHTQEQCE